MQKRQRISALEVDLQQLLGARLLIAELPQHALQATCCCLYISPQLLLGSRKPGIAHNLDQKRNNLRKNRRINSCF